MAQGYEKNHPFDQIRGGLPNASTDAREPGQKQPPILVEEETPRRVQVQSQRLTDEEVWLRCYVAAFSRCTADNSAMYANIGLQKFRERFPNE